MPGDRDSAHLELYTGTRCRKITKLERRGGRPGLAGESFQEVFVKGFCRKGLLFAVGTAGCFVDSRGASRRRPQNQLLLPSSREWGLQPEVFSPPCMTRRTARSPRADFVDSGPVVFQDISKQAGLTVWRHKMGSPEKKYILETPGSGVALAGLRQRRLAGYLRGQWLDL